MAPTKTPNAPRGTIRGTSSNQVVSFTIRAAPLPSKILNFVLDNMATWKTLQHDQKVDQGQAIEEDEETDNYGDVAREPTVAPEQFWDAFSSVCKEVGSEWVDAADKIWAFGPQRAGACLLIDSRKLKSKAS